MKLTTALAAGDTGQTGKPTAKETAGLLQGEGLKENTCDHDIMTSANYQTLKTSVDTSSLASGSNWCSPSGAQPMNSDENWGDGIALIDESTDRSVLENKTSNLQCLMHLFKGNIGPGILAMPLALKHAGLWVGFAGILVVGVIATHCSLVLIRCGDVLSKRTGSKHLGYAEVTEACLKTGPFALQKFARGARHGVNGLILCTQFGLCCIYIVFIATNVRQVITTYLPNDVDVRVYEVVVVATLLPYALLRNLRLLAPFSSAANLVALIGLVIVFQYLFRNTPSVDSRPAFTGISGLPLYLGTAFFTFEGIILILPIKNSMKNPESLGGWTGLLNLAMVAITCLFAAMGFSGYLCFGDDTLGSITLNLPNDDWLYVSVRVMFSLVVFVSYGVQFYVPIKIIWPSLEARLQSEWLKTYGEYLLRIFFVFVTAAFALLVPHLDLLIALTGAFSSSCLALIFPVTIEMLTILAERGRPSMVVLAKDVLIVFVGLIACVTGTYTALRDIVNTF